MGTEEKDEGCTRPNTQMSTYPPRTAKSLGQCHGNGKPTRTERCGTSCAESRRLAVLKKARTAQKKGARPVLAHGSGLIEGDGQQSEGAAIALHCIRCSRAPHGALGRRLGACEKLPVQCGSDASLQLFARHDARPLERAAHCTVTLTSFPARAAPAAPTPSVTCEVRENLGGNDVWTSS